MANDGYQLVFTTCPNQQLAEKIGKTLVEERLAACVNVLAPMQSIYRWKGAVEAADEQLVIIKIRAQDYPSVEQRLRALHSYELPEIIAIPISAGLPQYLRWLANPDDAHAT